MLALPLRLVAVEGVRPLEVPWEAAKQTQVEWKDGWDATYEANAARWKGEIEKQTRDGGERQRLMARRVAELLQQLIERYPGDAERRVAAYREMAECFEKLGSRATANACLKRAMDQAAGQWPQATGLLQTILEKTHRERHETEDAAAWQAYAFRRLVALREAGCIAETHPALELAWKTLLEWAVERGRLADAWRALTALDRITGHSEWWEGQRAELIYLAGRREEARRLFDDLVAQGAKGRAASLLRQLEREQLDAPPTFPRRSMLETRWDAARGGGGAPDAAFLAPLFEEAGSAGGLVPSGREEHVAFWCAMDDELRGLPATAQAGLREHQEREARRRVRAVLREGDPQALVAAWRRWPWAACVHGALVECGQKALVRGHAGLASRAFEDALTHASDGVTRSRARVGLWLAEASGGPAGAGPESVGEAKADAKHPWLGGEATAAAIRKRLGEASARGRPGPSPLEALRRRELLAPPAAPWVLERFHLMSQETASLLPEPAVRLQAQGKRVVLGGPSVLACFGGDARRPAWWRTPHRRVGATPRALPYVTVPGLFEPAIDGDRVFSRWGLDASGRYPTGLEAFDAESGQVVWSTADDPSWTRLVPVSDPVVADGRIYALAIRDTESTITPVWLVCVDAADGRTLWQRMLASGSLGLSRATGAPSFPARELDLVHYGSSTTVTRGEVYCSASMGFVARCDARDGLVEWTHTYPRVRLGSNFRSVVRRLGARPVVAGDAVVFCPRDCTGLFALERRTGKLLWERSFVGCDEVVGLAGGVVIARAEGSLVGLEARSGRVVWEREFEKGLEGRAILEGEQVTVQTGGRLLRVAASTGCTTERGGAVQGEPARDVVVCGEELIALTDRLISAPAVVRDQSAAAAESELRLPLVAAWELPAEEPTLWQEPPEAGETGRVYVFSQGLLTCLGLRRRQPVLWRRMLRPGRIGVAWWRGAMLLIYSDGVAALDAATGEPRWRASVPFAVYDWGVCGDLLFLGRVGRQGRVAAMVELKTGKVLWHRQLSDVFHRRYSGFDAFGWDGKMLHLFTRRFRVERRTVGAEFTVRAADGRFTAFKRFPGAGGDWPPVMTQGRDFVFFAGADGVFREQCLSTGSTLRYDAESGAFDPRKISHLKEHGPWRHVFWHKRTGGPEKRHWVLWRDEPGFVLRRTNWGIVRGSRLYERSEDKRTLTAIGLPKGTEVAYRLPDLPVSSRPTGIAGFYTAGERVHIVSGFYDRRGQAWRVDSFAAKSGAHESMQVLADIGGSKVAVAGSSEVLVVADRSSVRGLVAEPQRERPPPPVHSAYLARGLVRVDGSLDDWAGEAVVPLGAGREPVGSLHVTHDEKHLYVAVRYKDAEATPWMGGRQSPSGDRLELGLKTNRGVFRWTAGLGPHGRTLVAESESAGGLAGARVVMRHDGPRGEFGCELSLPKASVFALDGEWRRMGVWAAATDDRRAAGSARRLFRWGSRGTGPDGRPIRHAPFYLDAGTRRQDEAIAALIHRAPELGASFELLKKRSSARSSTPEALAERYWAFVERHPASSSAERLFPIIAALLRGTNDPNGRVLERAERAGVPEAARQRFVRAASACLSQWVYLTEEKRPRSLLVEINSGMGVDPWAHRAYWGDAITGWLIPPCRMGSRDEIPVGKWHELRIPLALINLHDKPICGINFVQQGPPRVVWDRSAVVAEGHQEVFIDDETPRGSTGGAWEWVGKPVLSGAAAHTNPPPANYYHLARHVAFRLDSPVIGHLEMPLDRPYLSQWVFLDPEDPPESLAICLHDGATWQTRAIWGKRDRRGRAMGKLPQAGGWQELLLPLAWTEFRAQPIAGIAFSHLGGRVVWDTTALVVDGERQVLIDDEAPAAGRPSARRQWRSWADGHVGGTWPVPGKIGVGMLCDGASGHVRVDHREELDPTELTIEAWIYLEKLPDRGTKRWIVNKNGHSWRDGYFALLICGDKVVADLNVGGGEENRFQAWSDVGALEAGRWHHVAMTYDGAVLRVYRDGECLEQTQADRRRTPGRGGLFIGRWAYGYEHLAGIVDEVRIYRRALSAAEIAARVAEPGKLVPEVADAVTAYWPFDDEAEPVSPAGEWTWVEQPVHSGRRAHTDAPAKGWTGHSVVPLKAPIEGHLPFERREAVALLKREIPELGLADEVWAFFNDLLRLELADPAGRAELSIWFLTTFPQHPRIVEVLGNLLGAYRDAGDPDAEGRVEKLIGDLGLSTRQLYDYQRRHACPVRRYVRSWQLLGPFPAEGEEGGFAKAYPPETDGIRLRETYEGAAGRIGWKLHHSDADYVNLNTIFAPAEQVVAYAAAWVHSDRPRTVLLAAGSDDFVKVWVNDRLALTGRNRTYAVVGDFLAPVRLAVGWNEVLVKVTEKIGEWRFYFEVLDERARPSPEGLKIVPLPPGRQPGARQP